MRLPSGILCISPMMSTTRVRSAGPRFGTWPLFTGSIVISYTQSDLPDRFRCHGVCRDRFLLLFEQTFHLGVRVVRLHIALPMIRGDLLKAHPASLLPSVRGIRHLLELLLALVQGEVRLR